MMTKPTSNSLSSNTVYSHERELPTGLKMNPWARAVWWKKHPSGPVATVWHLHPMHLYVAGWVSWAGGKVIPTLVDGQFEVDTFLAEFAIDDLAKRVFELGPSEAMIEKSAQIAKKYAENGRKGGRGNRKGRTASAPSWPTKFPGYSFQTQKGEVVMRGPNGAHLLVSDLDKNAHAKDLAWWNDNGPTKAIEKKFLKLTSG